MEESSTTIISKLLTESLTRQSNQISELQSLLTRKHLEYEKKTKRLKEQEEFWRGKFHAVKHENNKLRKQLKKPSRIVSNMKYFSVIHEDGTVSTVSSLQELDFRISLFGNLSTNVENGDSAHNSQVQILLGLGIEDGADIVQLIDSL